MLALFLLLIILGSCYMALRRFKADDRGYALAWTFCALINLYCLIRYHFFPPAL